MSTRQYKADLADIAEGYQTARDNAFDTQLTDFIRETREAEGVVTEDDIQGFLDNFTFEDEYEYCFNVYEEQREAYEDAKYEEYRDKQMGELR